MKRWLVFLLALACIVCAAPASAAQGAMRTTVLIYMSGSDLESEDGSATADIQEMLRANVPADGPLTVLVQTGGSEKWQLNDYPDKKNCLYRISSDGYPLLETLGKRNMGDPDTLSEFLEYGRENYPADRYILVLWGHGDGPTGGVCFDALYDDDSLMLDELAGVLGDAERAGQRINAVIFDACMMNSADLLFSLGAYTDCIVASQESTLGSGGRYDLWLSALAQNPEMDALEICARFAACYVSTGSHGLFSQTTTASVLDCRASEALRNAAEAFYGALNRRFDDSADEICAAVADLVSFGELDGSPPSGLMDAQQLCDALESFAPTECDALRAAMERTVAFHADSGAQEGATCGLSLFLPCARQSWFDALYDWYRPLSDGSSYAQLILRMAEKQESGSGTSILGFLKDAFSGSDVPDPPVVDAQHIWQGLGQAANPAGSAHYAIYAVDMQHVWQESEPNSDPAASAGSAQHSTHHDIPSADAQHIWQGLLSAD